MKKNLSKFMKTIALSVLAVAMVAVGSFGLSTGAKASETTIVDTEESGVIYVKYANIDYDAYFGKSAPKYTGVDANGVGYVFGGWYAKKDNTYDAIANTDKLTEAQKDNTVTIVAKFVPAQVLSVKCQNWAGTNVESDRVVVRVISATDSTNYSQYGFVISKIVDGVETPLGTFESKDGDAVYPEFNYYESADDTEPDVYVPSQLFGNAAKHFTTCTVGYIPKTAHGTIICIKPYWKTLDGTTVNGLSKFAHVEDGYLGYVNVPVNLNILSENNKAAAGYLSVACRSEGLTFLGIKDGVEYGKVFDEMEVNVTSDGIIKCVGNTSGAEDKDTNDIYVNLKFKRDDFNQNDQKPTTNFVTFSVENEAFVNSDETSTTADVWNVIY